MDKTTEMIWKRNKVIVWILWSVLAIAIVQAFFDASLWVTNIAGVVLCAAIDLMNRRQIGIRVIPWVITAILAAFSIYFNFGKIETSTALIFCIVLLIYPHYKYFAVAFGLVLINMPIQIMNGAQVAAETSKTDLYADVFAMFLLTGAALVSVAFLNLRMYRSSERQREASETAGRQVEFLLERVQQSAEGLKRFSEQTKLEVNEVGSITNEVILAFREVARGMEEQAGSVTRINDALAVSDSHIEDVTKYAGEMQRLSEETATAGDEGDSQMETLVGRIDELDETMNRTSRQMQDFTQASRSMSDILAQIDQISRQTHLLSLNASIEAARAGDHGRGFAVVAGEVGALAGHSSESAGQIGEILNGLQQQIEALDRRLEEGLHTLEQSKSSTRKTGEVFAAVRRSAHSVLEQAQRVQQTSSGLRDFSGRMVGEMSEVAGITEQSSAASEQILASMEEQRSMTGRMTDSFGELEALIVNLNRLVIQEPAKG
ncbi:methyl-accepting chemotaxis protein [Saccharibacillus brassicae]|uniref:Methyl-accepting chemotaxis protein n=1 Tax=Saccharibacillus brassicae TaxID=2583377 RepID=A0A4Y6V2H0_SACBS|nr:methyl-accepting chemotaxis protein [Saccharibacillus brassicae]QDH22445.1 methyl-accepting chemotaxis protein [Saccharibacillus brassicae]